MRIDRVTLATAVSLGLLLLLSLALFVFLPGSLTRTVLTFPEELTGNLVPEVRYLPFTWEEEHNVRLLTNEVVLGPARHTHQRLFSRQATVRTVLVRGGVIYVDLDKSSFIPDPDVLYSPQRSLDVLKKTLLDNFTNLASVQISIDGASPIEKSR